MGFVDQSAFTVAPLGNVSRRYLADEQTLVRELAAEAHVGQSARGKIQATAVTLVSAVRKKSANEGGIDAFLRQYDLSSEEGVLLMCIAEALLRIPDAATADRLIAALKLLAYGAKPAFAIGSWGTTLPTSQLINRLQTHAPGAAVALGKPCLMS